VDRHLKTLFDGGRLKKFRYGMYCCRRNSLFEKLPPASTNWFGHFLKPILPATMAANREGWKGFIVRLGRRQRSTIRMW
jgi:hypothetical protein